MARLAAPSFSRMAQQAFTAIAYDNLHKAGNNARGQRVKALFDAFVKDAAAIGATTGFSSSTKEFYLKDFPTAEKKVHKLLQDLHDNLQMNIEEGNENAWAISNSKNDAMVQDLVARASAAGIDISEERQEQWTKRNTDALASFQQRTAAGMNLSDRVWNLCDQTKSELEMALEIGLGDGLSAAALTKDVRKYLREPDKLFRRVRDKATGKLRLSKAAQAYHPGRGVYRSSYKNALRMTATENNMAYRTADHTRWNQLDFVLGIEVHLSNNHTLNGAAFVDICDELAGKYPKEFKFVGWHPWCRCFVTSILPKMEDFKKYMELPENEAARYDFGGKKIDKLPAGFNKWMLDPKNQLRIANAKNLPYFIKENFIEGGWNAKSAQALRKGLTWVAAPKKLTPFDIAAKRHAARPEGYAEKVMAMYNKTRSIDKVLADAQAFNWNKDVADWMQVLHDVRFSKTSTLQQLEDRERIVLETIEKVKDRTQKAAQGALNAAADFRGSGMVKALADILESDIKAEDYHAIHVNTRALAQNIKSAQTSLKSEAQAAFVDAAKVDYNKTIQQKAVEIVNAMQPKGASIDYGSLRSLKEELESMTKHQKQLTLQTSTNVYKVADKYKTSTTVAKLQNEILKAQKANDYAKLDSLSRQLAKEVAKERTAQAAAAAAKAAAEAAQKAAEEAAKKAAELEARGMKLMNLEEQFNILQQYQAYMKPNSLAYRYIEDAKRYLANKGTHSWMQQSFEETMEKLKNQKGFMKIVTQNAGDEWMYMMKGATPKAVEFPKFPDLKGSGKNAWTHGDLSTMDYDSLKKELGSDMPPLMKQYEKSVARDSYTKDTFTKKHTSIEAAFKDYFDNCDFAHRVNHRFLDEMAEFRDDSYTHKGIGKGLYINEGIPTNLMINERGAQVTGYKDFTLKGKEWYDDPRRTYGHWAYGLQDDMYATVPKKLELPANEYYRCGTPVPKGDRTRAWSEGGASGYGDTQIILRKDRVITTWTFGNSLSERTIPSLASDPKVCSLDNKAFRGTTKKKFSSMSDVLSGSSESYVEMQYIPIKGRNITPYDFESITFPSEGVLKGLSQKAIDRYHEYGVDLYYWDGSKAVLWKKGKPQIALTAAEKQAVEKSANQLLANASAFENKDLDLQNMRDLLAKKDYVALNEEGKRLQKLNDELKARRDALRDLIPDVDAQHKNFTIDELETCHRAVKKQLDWYDNHYEGAFSTEAEKYRKIASRLKDDRNNVEHPELNPHARNKTRYSTWKIAQDAYDRKIAEYTEKANLLETRQALADFKALNSQSGKIKDLLQEAEQLLYAGDYKTAGEKLAEAEKVRAINAKNVARRHAREEKQTAAFGEATGIVFDKSEYTAAKRQAAKIFGTKTSDMAKVQAGFNEADQYMTKYASEMWSRLTQEEKEVAYLYTSGSCYINDPLCGRFYYKYKEGLDGSIRKSNHDINMLTSIIEKAKPLEEARIVQHAEDADVFFKRFGEQLTTSKAGMKSLIGKEGINNPFMSTSCAENGYFATQIGKNVIMDIYCPKGTKGIYCEPFAHWGDGKIYGSETTRYNQKGIKWSGKQRKNDAGDQVEFLLQRGTKLRITDVSYEGGVWHVKCDIIEQTARVAFNEKLSYY